MQPSAGSSVTTFKNLTLNNPSGSYLSSSQRITGELNISSGTFSTTGYNFTLVSDAKGTARIAPILGNFAGNITMERYLGPGPNSWRFLASPVSDVTLHDWQDDFVTSGYPGSSFPNFNFTSIYTYDETVAGIADNGYLVPGSSADPVVPGKGYWCYIGPVPVTVDVTGPPATFTQTFQVSYTSSGGPSEDGYTMVGNPYPCPIEWNSPYWSKTNINNAIYIWNPVLQQYASWVGGVATNGGSSRIASSQSFWVQASGFNPALSCTENIKVSSNTPFLKPAPVIFDQLKLVLEGNSYKDETYLQFGTGATTTYDPDKDARKLFSTNPLVPGIATQDSTLTDMSINSLPAVNSALHIPVKTRVGISGSYSIRVDSSSSFSSSVCLVLEDLLTGIYTNLNAGAVYSFSISDTTQAPRFLIHVTPAPKVETMSASCNASRNGKAFIRPSGNGPWTHTWYDSKNTLLKQTTTSTASADTLNNLAAGDYWVQSANSYCSSTTSLSISEPALVIAGFSLPAGNVLQGEQLSFINTSSGASSFTWNFGDASAADTLFTPGHTYMQPGTYAVTLIARQPVCADTLVQQVNVLKPVETGLSRYGSDSRFSIYPNPGNGLFFLEVSDLTTDALLMVHTASGEVVLSRTLTAKKTEVDLRGLSKGIYLYKVLLQDGSMHSGKMIVQ